LERQALQVSGRKRPSSAGNPQLALFLARIKEIVDFVEELVAVWN
jgi:hypothetical protein